MLNIEELKTDVLVIGSGIAGLSAAIKARQEGCDVLLVSKAAIGKQSATYFSGASFKYTTQKLDLPGYDSGPGRYIFDEQLIELHIQQAKESILWLKNLGAPLEPFGEWYRPLQSEDPKEPGAIMVESIIRQLKGFKIRTLGNCLSVNLLVREGRCLGAVGLDQNGDLLGLKARCTILATGGGASLYKESCSPGAMVGDGYAIALRAGLPVINMEFIQFETGFAGIGFPWQQARSPIKMTGGVRLVNQKGEDLIQKYLGLKWEQLSRYASFKFEESEKIIGLEAKEGPVFLDMTAISSSGWSNLPIRIKKGLEKCPRDVKKFPVKVIPIGHTYLGGVTIEKKGQTELHGLFAAGEVVGATYAGENSVNHLTRSLVMGVEAGKSAAQQSGEHKEEKIELSEWRKEFAFVEEVYQRRGKKRPSELREQIAGVINEHMSPVRSADSLRSGMEKLRVIKEERNQLSADNTPDLKEAIEVENMSLLAEVLLKSAEFRRESRGPHYREDYSKKDPNFYKATKVKLDRKGNYLQVGF